MSFHFFVSSKKKCSRGCPGRPGRTKCVGDSTTFGRTVAEMMRGHFKRVNLMGQQNISHRCDVYYIIPNRNSAYLLHTTNHKIINGGGETNNNKKIFSSAV
jgi:hypothetical protein